MMRLFSLLKLSCKWCNGALSLMTTQPWPWKTKRKCRISKKRCGNLTTGQVEAEGEVMQRRSNSSAQISHLHVESLWRHAQKHKCFGKIMALLLTKTLEDIAKVEARSLLRQNKYLIWCCLYLSHLRLGFFASSVPSSPHLAYDLHQKKPAKLPSSLPQQHPDEGLHSVLWPVTLCSSGQEGRPVCKEFSSAVPSFCAAISWQSVLFPSLF